jgi:hypothetical protein
VSLPCDGRPRSIQGARHPTSTPFVDANEASGVDKVGTTYTRSESARRAASTTAMTTKNKTTTTKKKKKKR